MKKKAMTISADPAKVAERAAESHETLHARSQILLEQMKKRIAHIAASDMSEDEKRSAMDAIDPKSLEMLESLSKSLPSGGVDPVYAEALLSEVRAIIGFDPEIGFEAAKADPKDGETDQSSVRWTKDTGFFTTAPAVASSRDAGIAALVVFESEAQLRRNLSRLEGGSDPCWVGYFAPLIGPKNPTEEASKTPETAGLSALAGAETDPTKVGGGTRISIQGQSTRGFRLREKSGEVFVEIEDPKKTRRDRVHARTLDGGNVVHLLGADGRLEEKIDLSTFVRRRERRRQRDEAAIIPNRADAIIRSTLSTSGADLHAEEIRKTIRARPVGSSEMPDGRATSLGKWIASANPAEAYQVAVALTDESRRKIAALEAVERKRKKSKTRVDVSSTDTLPFDETKVEIVPGQARQAAADAISNQFMESIQRSLTPSLMQTMLAVFSLAFESPEGTVIQNVDALLRVRGTTDGGKQRKQILEELDTLGKIQFRLSIRQTEPKKGDKVAFRWLEFPVLRKGLVKGATHVDGKEVIESTKWRIDEDFLSWLQAKRSLAIIDRALFALDSVKEEWEWRLGVAISTRWSKGWLGGEMLCESDGRVEWKVETLVDAAGLGLKARDLIRTKSKKTFRDRFRKALETLQRCGPASSEAIGDFTIRKHPTDPLLDLVTISPTPGMVETFRERVLGKAETKAIDSKAKA